MGCTVGTSRANSLRDVQQEVSDLRRRLDDNDKREKVDAALKLEYAQKEQEIAHLKYRLEESDREKADLRSRLADRESDKTPLLSESKFLYGNEEPEDLKAELNRRIENNETPPELTPPELTPGFPPDSLGVAVEPLGQPAMLVPGSVNVDETHEVAPASVESIPAHHQAAQDISPPELVTEQASNDPAHINIETEVGDTVSVATVIVDTGQPAEQSVEDTAKQADDPTQDAAKQVDASSQDIVKNAETPTVETNIEDEATKKKDQDDGKMTGTMISDASTATPAANTAPAMKCHQCGEEKSEDVPLYIDQNDLQRYCGKCWEMYYGYNPAAMPTQRTANTALVPVVASEPWMDSKLAQAWAEKPIAGWPPCHFPSAHQWVAASDGENEVWSSVAVRVRREIVGSHAREHNNLDRPVRDEVLRRRYKCKQLCGEGHFTKAFLAEDLKEGGFVCVKRHRNLSVDALCDFLVLGTRLREVDEDGAFFPRLVDAFYDIVGFTVETLLDGTNLLNLMKNKPGFFNDLKNLRYVAQDGMRGLQKLERAGIVHNDVKADNLMWLETPQGAAQTRVRIVDFGCARLDCREEPAGRNWALGEGGAGHLGKWSPEMVLRLPIDHKADVWGFTICLCELHCQRNAWRSEADTAEVILAQGLGLANQQDGIPLAMIKRSGLDIRLLYTPQPKHFPLRRSVMGMLEVLRPQNWGLEQVLGDNWREIKGDLGRLLEAALVIDPMERPSASELLEMKFCQREADSNEVEKAPPEETQEPLQQELVGQATESPEHLV